MTYAKTYWLAILTLFLFAGCAVQPIDINSRLSPGQVLDDQLLERAIKSDIAQAFKREDNKGFVRPVVFNGVAYLFGTVTAEAHLKEILSLVEEFRHIEGTYNEIKIRSDFAPLINVTDKRIEAQANVRLGRNTATRGALLRVVVHGGDLYLIGLTTRRVGESAIEVAKNIRGVSRVVVLIEYLD